MNRVCKTSTTVVAVLSGGAAIAAMVVLYLFEPGRFAIYPVCRFHEYTGWVCAGCGSLRALHQLAHGNVAAAFGLNPLLVMSLPVVAWLGIRALRRRWLPAAVATPFIKASWAWTAVGVLLSYSVLRNLPGFGWMAP